MENSKALVVAIGIFLCWDDTKTPMGEFEKLQNVEDGTEQAHGIVTVWEPFEGYSVDQIVQWIEDTEDTIKRYGDARVNALNDDLE